MGFFVGSVAGGGEPVVVPKPELHPDSVDAGMPHPDSSRMPILKVCSYLPFQVQTPHRPDDWHESAPHTTNGSAQPAPVAGADPAHSVAESFYPQSPPRVAFGSALFLVTGFPWLKNLKPLFLSLVLLYLLQVKRRF